MRIRPTPEEDEPHPQLCAEAVEQGLKLALQAEETEDRALWGEAAECFDEARYQAMMAAAQITRRWIAVQIAQGLMVCASCHQWLPREELTREVVGYQSKTEARNSHMWRCQPCREKEA